MNTSLLLQFFFLIIHRTSVIVANERQVFVCIRSRSSLPDPNSTTTHRHSQNNVQPHTDLSTSLVLERRLTIIFDRDQCSLLELSKSLAFLFLKRGITQKSKPWNGLDDGIFHSSPILTFRVS